MKTITTQIGFVKLTEEESKRLTILWQNTDAGNIDSIAVYATDKNYQNGKLIPDADVIILNDDKSGSKGFQFSYLINKGDYDFYFQIIATMEDNSQVIYNANSFYKTEGNPTSEGDSAKPLKP
ncbi:MAG: hypothetical protein IPP60_01260 [Sphingobacteriales bacterium]|nr:hypothetical protein [Sphingobacteriales bacterium]